MKANSPRTAAETDGGARVSDMLDDAGSMSECLDLALKQEIKTEDLTSNFPTIHNTKTTIVWIKAKKTKDCTTQAQCIAPVGYVY